VPANESAKAGIFISYGRQEDDEFVERLCQRLAGAGFSVWRDQSDLPNRGLTFPQELLIAIRSQDRLVFVAGPRSIASEWCSSEWQHALEEGKPVHPVLRLGEIGMIPADLRFFDIRDFRDQKHFETEFKRLVEQLSEPVFPAGKLVDVPRLPASHFPSPSRLRELKEAFLADRSGPGLQSGVQRVLGLHGMSGSGKSVLAAALVSDYAVRRAHHDGIYWVRIGQQQDLVVLQEALACLLDCRKQAFRDVQEGRLFLSDALKEKDVLLILDDVCSAEHLDAFDCLGPRCRMLVTTQDRGLVIGKAGKEYPVNLPSAMEARALLARCAGCRDAELPPQADLILKECENLPLAVSICGRRVAGGASWSDVLEGLRAADPRFLEGRGESVFRSIGAAVTGLTAEDGRRLAELVVFFLDEPVPQSVACLLWGRTGQLSPVGGRDVLRALANHHLVELQPAKLPDREAAFTIHALVQHYLRRLHPSPTEIHASLVEACRSACAGSWGQLAKTQYWHRHLPLHMARAGRWDDLADLAFGGEFDLFQRWTERGEWHAGEECLQGLLTGLPSTKANRPRRAAVATQLARVLQLRGDYSKAREYAKKALAGTWLRAGVRAHLVALHELGNLELADGKPRAAIRWFLRKLGLGLIASGRNDDELVSALCGLAAAQRDRYSWRSALLVARLALNVARRGGDRRGELQALILVGATLKSIGNYAGAEDHFRNARRVAAEEADSVEVAHLLAQWGWMAFAQAALAGALPAEATARFREAAEQAELAGSYSLLADALNGLAWSRLVEGCPAEAREGFARARSLVRGASFPSIENGIRLGELALEYVGGNREIARLGLGSMIDDCRQRKELLWRSHACVGLGACEWHQGRQEAARRAWSEAEKSARKISAAARSVILASISTSREHSQSALW
jgi:tetratricopeptide (TPR) repeat protein